MRYHHLLLLVLTSVPVTAGKEPRGFLSLFDFNQTEYLSPTLGGSLEEEEWRGILSAQSLYGDQVRQVITGVYRHQELISADSKPRHKRAVSAEPSWYWHDAILPYVFEADVPPSEKHETLNAFRRHERFTCVRFVPWVKNRTRHEYQLPDESHIVLVKRKGCWSAVGNTHNPKGQKISCCSRGACVHELSHALGVFHDHCSPARHGWIRVNWNNVDKDQWDIFGELEPNTTHAWQYDLTSIMHYHPHGFKKGPWPTMTVLFKDLAPLINKRGNVFYLWQEIAETHRCKARLCPDFDIDCVNDGYVSYVENQCRCICPPGLDYKTGCSTILKSVTAPSRWPSGSYGTLATSDGCPSMEFSPLNMSFNTRLYVKSPNFHLAGNFTWVKFDLQFCMKDSNIDPKDHKWQTGRYCLLKNKICPLDFTEKYVPVDKFNITLCCRDDGFSEDPIYTPVDHPFILFPLTSQLPCQTVEGMHGFSESMEILGELTEDKMPGGIPVEVTRDDRVTISFCYYVKSNRDCGEVVELSAKDMFAVIFSPGFPDPYGPVRECYWMIKGPKNSNIILNFDDFHVGEGEEGCDEDYLIIRYVHPGQNAYRKCGKDLPQTFRSVRNIITLHLHSSLVGSQSGFTASVFLVLPETHCFNQEDNGRSYRGKVNFTRDFQPCLPWDRVTECPHHMFNPRDFDGMLEENYCRNPDNSFRPWCYTKTYEGQCDRNYCDVCRLERAIDVVPDCEQLKKEGFCQKDPKLVMSQCAKTCAVKLPRREATSSCSRPPQIADALMTFDRRWYKIGETVTHKCPYGEDSVTRRCHSDGTWSPGNFVCGACPLDWVPHHSHCYRFYPTLLTYKKAEDFCASHHAIVSPAKTYEELEFIVSLRVKLRPMWVGVTLKKKSKIWMNSDNTVLGINHWIKGKPNVNDALPRMCAIINSEQANNTFRWASCTKYRPFVCKMTPSSRRRCVNRRWDCGYVLRRNPRVCRDFPSFASQQCPFSCGICDPFSTPFCTVQPPGENVVATNDVTPRYIPRGDAITYACRPGTILVQGELSRICQVTGLLSGDQPKCADTEDLATPINNIALVDRLQSTSSKVAYIGNNDLHRIHKKGEITQWRFYAKAFGKVALQVWRPRPDIGAGKFEFIGQNYIDTKAGRINTVDIPPLDRIEVSENDVIGLWSGVPSPEITFSLCTSSENPEGNNSYVLFDVKAMASFFHLGQVYGTKAQSCRRFSVTAYVNKTSQVRVSRTHAAPLISAEFLITQPHRVYTGNNSYFRIRVNGTLVGWELYSLTATTTALQVWRHRPDVDSNKYEFIGENIIQTVNDSKQTIHVPGEDQISVRENDLIGIWYGNATGGVPYEKCFSRENPEALPLAWNKFDEPFEEGQLYTFKPISTCRVFSFVALVHPQT